MGQRHDPFDRFIDRLVACVHVHSIACLNERCLIPVSVLKVASNEVCPYCIQGHLLPAGAHFRVAPGCANRNGRIEEHF